MFYLEMTLESYLARDAFWMTSAIASIVTGILTNYWMRICYGDSVANYWTDHN